MVTVTKGNNKLNGDVLGTSFDLQGKDARAELLVAALDNQAIDSRELIREDMLV